MWTWVEKEKKNTFAYAIHKDVSLNAVAVSDTLICPTLLVSATLHRLRARLVQTLTLDLRRAISQDHFLIGLGREGGGIRLMESVIGYR